MMRQDLDGLNQNIVNLYSQIELELLLEVAKRFDVSDSIGGTLEWQIKKLEELGALNGDAARILAAYSQKSEQEIRAMLERAGFGNISLPDLTRAFHAGLLQADPQTLLNSPTFKNVLENSYKELEKSFKLIQTKALESVKQVYMDVLNRSYVEVTSGVYDYNTSIRRALQRMAQKGITGATYKRCGKLVRYSLEGTVRRDTLTAVHQLANRTAVAACAEMGVEYVEVSKHLGARVHPTNPIANHYGWQGGVYKLEGRTKRYRNLREATGYLDDILGLGGVNCRHRLFPFIPGISTPNPVRYEEEENRRKYEKSQQQRRMEREIRLEKKKMAVANACGDEAGYTKAKKRLLDKQATLDTYCKENGLQRDYSRELVTEQITKPVAKSTQVFYTNTDSRYERPITEASIQNVQDVLIHGLTDAQAEMAANKRRALLQTMQGQTPGMEGSVVVPLDGSPSPPVHIGKMHKTGIDDLPVPYYAIHNHPDNGVLSPGDISGFLNLPNMKGLEAIGNDGATLHSIVKTGNADTILCTKHVKMRVNQFLKQNPNLDSVEDFTKLNDFSLELLRECEKYGFKITNSGK